MKGFHNKATRNSSYKTVDAVGMHPGRPASTTATPATQSRLILDRRNDLRGCIERSLREREPGSHVEQAAATPESIQRSGCDRNRSVTRERPLRGDHAGPREERRRRETRRRRVWTDERRRDRSHATADDLRRRPVENGDADVDGGHVRELGWRRHVAPPVLTDGNQAPAVKTTVGKSPRGRAPAYDGAVSAARAGRRQFWLSRVGAAD